MSLGNCLIRRLILIDIPVGMAYEMPSKLHWKYYGQVSAQDQVQVEQAAFPVGPSI